MSITHNLVSALNVALGKMDVAITRKSWVDAQLIKTAFENEGEPSPPPSAGNIAYLSWQNPRLAEINEQYSRSLPSVMRPSRWTTEYQGRHIDLTRFRGDNAYVFSDKNIESTYALTSYYLSTFDRLNLLELLLEDGLFGAKLFRYKHDFLVSRDLIDSIAEIYAIISNIPPSVLQDGTILDIGAGYGRLAHRLTAAVTSIKNVMCADAVPLSTFICEYYLRCRSVNRAFIVSFPEIESKLLANPVSLAINIHSFSECPLAAIEWWLRLVSRHSVPYLFLVPNAADHGGTKLLSQEIDGSRLDYAPLIQSCGYKRFALMPKYADDVIQSLGVSPTHYHFFQLS
jgi:SAM-dependent methyltransferase